MKIFTPEKEIQWDHKMDTYILAKLIKKHGFDQIIQQMKDPLWSLLNQNALKALSKTVNPGLSLKNLIKSIKTLDQKTIDEI